MYIRITYIHIELQARLVELLRINIVTRADVSEEALPTGTKKKLKNIIIISRRVRGGAAYRHKNQNVRIK